MRTKAASLCVAGFCLLATIGVSRAADDPHGIEFFENKIRPVLVAKCYSCHSADAKSVKGGLYVDTRAGIRQGGESGHAVVPGEVAESLIIGALRHEDFEMPPKEKLPEEVINDFVQWIKIGAPDPRNTESHQSSTREIDIEAGRQYWAFRKLAPVEVPGVGHAAADSVSDEWSHTDLDRFVYDRLCQEGLGPVGDATREALIRRLSYDLTGLPPTPQQIDDFVADTADNAVERVVDRLLESPAFGERWGRHWLDLARYAESTGRTRNYAHPFAYRYRDYVIDAINADMPYDRFVREQIAGDLIQASSENDQHQALVATAFLALGPYDLNERDVAKFHMDVVDEQINVVCRSVLGLTAGCARCHDHKFDPIPTQDYYALAGVFRSTDLLIGYGPRQGGNNSLNADRFIPLGTVDEASATAAKQAQQEAIKAVQEKVERLKKQMAKWRKAMNAKPRQDKAENDSPLTAQEARQKFNKAKQQQKRLAKQLKQLRQNRPLVGNLAMGVSDGDAPRDTRVHLRGDVKSLGDPVQRGLFQVLADEKLTLDEPEHSGRLELARWLTDSELPAGSLAARVMVNRVWQHLFGQGIVRTVDNFGEMGDTPSHAELLDYLANEFIESGWSLKSMVRSIVLSRTYQLSSHFDQSNYAVDPENRFLWRHNSRRVEAEELRDAMLAVSGNLKHERPQPPKYNKGELNARQINERDHVYRSVYLPIVRSFVPQLLTTFDFADPNDVHGRRDVTTVAPQALFMMNNEFVIQQAETAAEKMISTEWSNESEAIRVAYRTALGRYPSDTEIKRTAQYMLSVADGDQQKSAKQRAWASFYQALFASAEFRYVN